MRLTSFIPRPNMWGGGSVGRSLKGWFRGWASSRLPPALAEAPLASPGLRFLEEDVLPTENRRRENIADIAALLHCPPRPHPSFFL